MIQSSVRNLIIGICLLASFAGYEYRKPQPEEVPASAKVAAGSYAPAPEVKPTLKQRIDILEDSIILLQNEISILQQEKDQAKRDSVEMTDKIFDWASKLVGLIGSIITVISSISLLRKKQVTPGAV